MRSWLLVGMGCLSSACAGTSSDDAGDGGSADMTDAGAHDAGDGEPGVIRTTEVCKVATDCKMAPGTAYCPDPRTAVRYDEPSCGADQRCIWYRIEDRCSLRCEEGVCITAAR